MKTKFRNCPICDGDTSESLHRQNFVLPEGHPLSDGYEVVCCVQCGFVYADTAVSQESYDLFYAQYSKYEDKQTGTGGVQNKWDHERVQETAQQVANYLGNPSLSILDVGCANGGLLKSLSEAGFVNLLGLDVSPVCIENTRQLGINAEVGSLSQPLIHLPFDCIVLSHTLEHVHNLKKAADWITSMMKDTSIVYIEVPDASRYKDFVDAPFQDFNTEHINHFSIASLKNYLRINGFNPVAWGQKVIPASSNRSYPALFCFAQKLPIAGPLEVDLMLRSDIEDYIHLSRSILDSMDKELVIALSKNARIIVWGTGQLTMKLLMDTSLAKADIIAFVDSNPINQGKIIKGIKVVHPEEIREYTEPILISSTLHRQSIIEQIKEMNLNNPLITLKDNS